MLNSRLPPEDEGQVYRFSSSSSKVYNWLADHKESPRNREDQPRIHVGSKKTQESSDSMTMINVEMREAKNKDVFKMGAIQDSGFDYAALLQIKKHQQSDREAS